MREGGGYLISEWERTGHEQVGTAPDGSRADAWRGVLTPRQVEIFESRTGDMLALLGYPQLYELDARAPSVFERVGNVARGRWMAEVTNPVRFARRLRRGRKAIRRG